MATNFTLIVDGFVELVDSFINCNTAAHYERLTGESKVAVRRATAADVVVFNKAVHDAIVWRAGSGDGAERAMEERCYHDETRGVL
jgi:hypothetical protein